MSFVREFSEFLKKSGSSNEAHAAPIPKSVGFMNPGDLLFFNYEGVNVGALVVRNDAGPGHYMSTRNNMLITVFKIDHLSQETFRIVIKNLYKSSKASRKRVIKSLKAILGIDSYRSYMLSKMTSTFKVFAQPDEF